MRRRGALLHRHLLRELARETLHARVAAERDEERDGLGLPSLLLQHLRQLHRRLDSRLRLRAIRGPRRLDAPPADGLRLAQAALLRQQLREVGERDDRVVRRAAKRLLGRRRLPLHAAARLVEPPLRGDHLREQQRDPERVRVLSAVQVDAAARRLLQEHLRLVVLAAHRLQLGELARRPHRQLVPRAENGAARLLELVRERLALGPAPLRGHRYPQLVPRAQSHRVGCAEQHGGSCLGLLGEWLGGPVVAGAHHGGCDLLALRDIMQLSRPWVGLCHGFVEGADRPLLVNANHGHHHLVEPTHGARVSFAHSTEG